MVAGLLGALLGIVEKYVPEGTRRAEVVADLSVRAIESLGWAHKWLAIIFGVSLSVNLNAVVFVPVLTGEHIPAVWFAILIQLAVLMLLLGRSLKEIKDLWEMVEEASGRD